MSDRNPYTQLGVSENATFEEIQTHRNRLMAEYSGDRKRQENIEAAYDAILMERLRMRQEGKIKVPEGIRFPENPQVVPDRGTVTLAKPEAPPWLMQLLDTPETQELLWPALSFLGLSAFALVSTPSLALAFGVGLCLYFLNRKHQRFARAFGITLIALIAGLSLGAPIGAWLAPQMAIAISTEAIAACFTLFVFWLTSSFLR
ncbi:MAG TPA: CPP1-like family protein [Oscillatoriaceae cyanobacterium M33_DOE_052]|uniref:Molecular chaperone DnaJ n=1 Tax=Planktothricoides sp. SpSt-374 TaxID=2282167 RepID=A0A7C3ZXA8_9CYAN|nr:CPP1-like family protein [Oscillatoriaceae cyanobacterium M33_DOE_052]